MQFSGVFTLKRRVLAENVTLHEVYKQREVELKGPLTIIIEEPNFLADMEDDNEVGLVFQITPSGTVDIKIIPSVPTSDEDEKENRLREKEDEELERKREARKSEVEYRKERAEKELEEAARSRVVNRKEKEAEKAKKDGTNQVTGQPKASVSEDELNEAMDEIRTEQEERKSSKDTSLGEASTIKADLTERGKLVSQEKPQSKKRIGKAKRKARR